MSTPPFRRAGAFLRPAVLLAFLLGAALPSHAANYTITAASADTLDLSSVGLQPGDTVFIQGHTRSQLIIQRLTGAPGNPITVTNTGGQFIIDNTTTDKGLHFQGCQYVVVQGTPSPGNYDYGIKIARVTHGGGIGVAFTNHSAGGVLTGSTDFEIRNVEIGNVGFAGLMAKNDLIKASTGFVMRNIRIHDLYIHDVGGEGMYVGSSFFGVTDPAHAHYNPHHIHNIEIDGNIVTNAGWDAIQLGCATQNASIHHNFISGYGISAGSNSTQDEGIRSNPGTAADIHHNWIQGSGTNSGTGIFANPYNSVKYYNNIIITPEESGMYVIESAAAHTYVSGYSVQVMNNTIIAPENYLGIHLSGLSHSAANLIQNNLIAEPGTGGILVGNGIPVTQSHNQVYSTVAAAGFVNAGALDFHLANGSTSIDAGTNLSAQGVTTDHDDAARPGGSAYDIGAFEVVAIAPNITAHPSGQTVTVGGAAAFTVVATGTPAPTYQWRKNGTNISGATSATLTLTNVQPADAASYTVVVANTAGSVTSNAAVLTVHSAIGIITPVGYGQAGAAYCPATGTFNEQPTWNSTNGVPVGISAAPFNNTLITYANRHWYIDFGANFASLRLTGTWTRYMPSTTASYSGLGAMWWDDDNDSTNDNGIVETGLDFGTAQGLNTLSTQPWVQDINSSGAPITPPRRYLIINTGSAPPGRANEFAVSGFTAY